MHRPLLWNTFVPLFQRTLRFQHVPLCSNALNALGSLCFKTTGQGGHRVFLQSCNLEQKAGEPQQCGPHLFENALEIRSLSLAEFPYLFGDRRTLPKTPEKTEMVLRYPLGFA